MIERLDEVEVDTDLARLDLALVHHWLSNDAYWARGRTREAVESAARGSLNFGAYAPDGRQVGYARVVTDRATYGWVCDVYVPPEHRGSGIGRTLAEAVVAECRTFGNLTLMLSTADAHGLYEQVGFTVHPEAQKVMVLRAESP